MRSTLAAPLLALALAMAAGCGGGDPAAAGDGGTATLWVTRDRGAEVLHEREVPAGLTVLQALREVADVETRYGGRFVQAIDGLEGSLADGRDWLFFVNGYEADRGAAEYRLRAGEVAWWDYRAWTDELQVGAVVGAFPEPFLHGYDGKTRPAAVRYELPAQADAARRLGEAIGADSVAPAGEPVTEGANLLLLARGKTRFTAETDAAGAPVRFVAAGDAVERLAADAGAARLRYEGVR